MLGQALLVGVPLPRLLLLPSALEQALLPWAQLGQQQTLLRVLLPLLLLQLDQLLLEQLPPAVLLLVLLLAVPAPYGCFLQCWQAGLELAAPARHAARLK